MWATRVIRFRFSALFDHPSGKGIFKLLPELTSWRFRWKWRSKVFAGCNWVSSTQAAGISNYLQTLPPFCNAILILSAGKVNSESFLKTSLDLHLQFLCESLQTISCLHRCASSSSEDGKHEVPRSIAFPGCQLQLGSLKLKIMRWKLENFVCLEHCLPTSKSEMIKCSPYSKHSFIRCIQSFPLEAHISISSSAKETENR